MKWTVLGGALVLVILAITFYDVRSNRPTTFRGEIMDSNCAEMGSHEAVMKLQGFQSPLQCALFCAHYLDKPSVWVLYDAANKKIYQLSDQGKAQPFATEKVVISGGYDDASKSIFMTSIATAP